MQSLHLTHGLVGQNRQNAHAIFLFWNSISKQCSIRRRRTFQTSFQPAPQDTCTRCKGIIATRLLLKIHKKKTAALRVFAKPTINITGIIIINSRDLTNSFYKSFKMHFFIAPNLRRSRQDFHQRSAQLCYRQPIPVGMCLHTTRSSQGSKLLFPHFLQRTSEPLLTLRNSSKVKFFQFGSCSFVHLQHKTHRHHKRTIILHFFPAPHAYQWNNNT